MGIWTAKVSPKGWIVIPAELRRKLGIRPGSTVHLVETADGVSLVRTHDDPVEALWGIATPPPGSGWDFDAWMEERRSEQRARDAALGIQATGSDPADRSSRSRPGGATKKSMASHHG